VGHKSFFTVLMRFRERLGLELPTCDVGSYDERWAQASRTIFSLLADK